MQIHATCVARDDRGVLLLGGPGAGKSGLALRLIERGFVLVADDRVELDGAMASPVAELAGLIEVRGLGIVRMSYRAPARIVLAVQLDTGQLGAGQLGAGQLGAGPERLPSPARDPLSAAPMIWLDPRLASATATVAVALDCVLGTLSCIAGGLENVRP